LSRRYSILAQAQHRRKLHLWLSATPLLFVMLFNAPDVFGEIYHESIEIAGLALIVICIAGRTWSSLYIAGRKNDQLVGVGPYSVVRNPLYVASMLGAAGVGMTSGSLLLGLLTAACCFIVFDGVIRTEESHLAALFGERYQSYAARVPRWSPRLSQWQDAAQVTVRPSMVAKTLLDASLFVLAVPLLEGLDILHTDGILPVLLHLP
jgi:protein-S-isoprenylcysteine O-methyltransferase Ste14